MAEEKKKTDFRIFPDYESICRKAADEIAENLHENPRQLLCIAAGHTSLGVFRELTNRHERGEIDFSQAGFVAMDEWADMDENTEGSCGWLLRKEFLSKAGYARERVFLWNGKAKDITAECKRAEDFIRDNSRSQAIDLLILGAGMNGHLALNEPGSRMDQRACFTSLDEVTVRVGQKYFEKARTLTGGLTLGLADFREARRAILLLSGRAKSDVVKRLRQASRFQTDFPVTALYDFANASIYCDRAAADGLQGQI